jgi:hypothetical protein
VHDDERVGVIKHLHGNPLPFEITTFGPDSR